MRNIWHIFCDDVRLAKSSLVAVLVVLGLCLIPALYAWFSIAICWNPFDNTSQLKVAVANSDEGYESNLIPFELNIGDRVQSKLSENNNYRWTFVDEQTAINGVQSGEYYAAITIPTDFSSKMMSALSSDSEQTNISFFLNTKENPTVSTLIGEGDSGLAEGIREKFTEAVDEMSLGLAADLVSFASSDKANEIGIRLVAHLGDVADSLDASANQVRMYSDFTSSASALVLATAELLTGSDNAADASSGVISEATEALDAALISAKSAVSSIEEQVNAAQSQSDLEKVGTDKAEKLAEEVSSLATSVSSISTEADNVAKALQKASTDVVGSEKSVATDLDSVRNDLGTAANKLGASASKIRKFQDDIAAALSKGSIGAVASMVGGNTASLAQWLSEPAHLEKHAIYSVETYGSSMAPFYTIVACWLGVVLLVLFLNTQISRKRLSYYEKEAGGSLKSFEFYFGHSLIFVVLALIQTTVVVFGNLLFLQIQCAQPLFYGGVCWLCAMVFANLAFVLVMTFGNVGKALCIFALALFAVGADGEYPLQMMSSIYQAVSSLLPFTYGMHALQGAVVGVLGEGLLFDLLGIVASFVVSLLIGIVLRRPLNRLVTLCSRTLAPSDNNLPKH